MYKVDTSKELDKFFAKHQDLAPKIIAKLELIEQNPYNNPCDIAKLQGQKKSLSLESWQISCVI